MADNKLFRVRISDPQGRCIDVVDVVADSSEAAMKQVRGHLLALDPTNDYTQPIEDEPAHAEHQVEDAIEIPGSEFDHA